MKTIKELLEFGFINIDKPTGPTSFVTGQIVKNMLGLKKTSHLGTLDPMVTGILPIALNRACRLNEYFMHRDKTYVGIMRLHEDVNDDKLNDEMEKFLGKIIQMPPVRSRVKRAEREREIKRFEIIERDGKDYLFISEVQAGTYIRKLIHDLGERIGGAHMLELRRIRAGLFSEENIVNLYEFEKAVKAWKNGDEGELRKIIIPAEEMIKKVLPVVDVEERQLKGLLTGKPLHKGEANVKDEKFAIFCGEKFIGAYKKVNEGEIIARAEFVFN
ncbi:hypothetical protein AUJ84_00060 [Candidatus Pacearchaeota archaeon CG1_02_32_132]|nr:MAG: hypothetical protein AUJ84_00060 [Candidatus Pacearchaeota archaeon CG1_02_32_132]